MSDRAPGQLVASDALPDMGHLAGRLWTETVLPVLQPDAMLLTGDLVDGKERHGHGQQLKSEWQVHLLQSRVLHASWQAT